MSLETQGYSTNNLVFAKDDHRSTTAQRESTSSSASGLHNQNHNQSLLSSLCGGTNDDTQSKNTKPLHIMLQGADHTERSSLAMDIAIEMASKAACQCHCHHQSNSRLCQCQPVVFLRVDRKVNKFPLRCYPIIRREQGEQSNTSTAPGLQHGNLTQTTTSTATATSTWTKQSLRKIQVHHAVNLQSCLRFLLALQGRPRHQQPYGAIIIDGIDCLSDDHHDGGSSKAKDSPSQHLSQILAILMDTINFLQCQPAAVVCVMKDDTNSNNKVRFPSTCFAASFFSGTVTLHPSLRESNQKRSWNRICEEHNVVLHGSWVAKWKPFGGGGTKDTASAEQCIEYVIVSNDSGTFKILWERK